MKDRRLSLLLVLAMIAALVPFAAAPAAGGVIGGPVINEFVANHTGSDTDAFIEIFGDPSTDLSAYTILEVEGDGSGSGYIDAAITVGTTDSGGYWIDDEDMENGTISILLVAGFTGAVGDDLDTDNDGAFDITPWTAIVDSIAVTDGGGSDHTYGVTLTAGFDGGFFSVGGASRIPNGVDTDTDADWVRNDFSGAGLVGFTGSPAAGEALNTPGAVNALVAIDAFGACGDPATLISTVQGSGSISPENGNVRTIEGVVVGDFETSSNLRGFFVQEEDGDADGDTATSEGIFVYNSWHNDVSEGDTVRVKGTVTEFNGLTEITNVSDLEVCPPGATVAPTIGTVPMDWESVEGMLMAFPGDLYISEFFNFDRFGEIVLTTDRQYQPSQVAEPGSTTADDIEEANEANRITLDDGRSSQNPDPARHPNGAEFTLTNRFRGGDILQGVTGVIDYAFGRYRIQPTTGATYVVDNPRPAAPDSIDGEIRVASFNVLNFFTTIDPDPTPFDGGDDATYNICGPTMQSDCRGADTQEEYQRQLDKLVAGILALDADVVGVQEIENDVFGDDVDGSRKHDPIRTLVDELNDAEGSRVWAWIGKLDYYNDYPVRNEIIYRIDSVLPIGKPVTLQHEAFDEVRPLSGLAGIEPVGRPPVAQTFAANFRGRNQVKATEIFTVVVNHFKSKGSSCSSIGDFFADHAGNCNGTRVAQAEALMQFVADLQEATGDDDVLVIGDLNSYAMEDPIDRIKLGPDGAPGGGDDFTDLLQDLIGPDAYGYVFDGQLGTLDHALASHSLYDQVKGVTVWHTNADEPDIFDYDTTFKKDAQDALYEPLPYRSSDHDPVIVGLTLVEED